MQEMKIHSLKHRRFKKTSIHTDYLQHPNLIKNKPKASTWWADITYLELQPGTWLYLSSVYEPKVHKILPYKIGRQMNTKLVVDIVKRALEHHKKQHIFIQI